MIHPGAEDPEPTETVDVLAVEQVVKMGAEAGPLQGGELARLGDGLPVTDEAAVHVALVCLHRLGDEGLLLVESHRPPLDQLEVAPGEREDLVVRVAGQADLISVQIWSQVAVSRPRST
jgi:hypothetical protein